jgi:hypothetical protein
MCKLIAGISILVTSILSLAACTAKIAEVRGEPLEAAGAEVDLAVGEEQSDLSSKMPIDGHRGMTLDASCSSLDHKKDCYCGERGCKRSQTDCSCTS